MKGKEKSRKEEEGEDLEEGMKKEERWDTVEEGVFATPLQEPRDDVHSPVPNTVN